MIDAFFPLSPPGRIHSRFHLAHRYCVARGGCITQSCHLCTCVEAGVSDCLGLLVYSKMCQSLGAHKVQEVVQPVIVVSDVALMNRIFNDISSQEFNWWELVTPYSGVWYFMIFHILHIQNLLQLFCIDFPSVMRFWICSNFQWFVARPGWNLRKFQLEQLERSFSTHHPDRHTRCHRCCRLRRCPCLACLACCLQVSGCQLRLKGSRGILIIIGCKGTPRALPSFQPFFYVIGLCVTSPEGSPDTKQLPHHISIHFIGRTTRSAATPQKATFVLQWYGIF